MPKRAHPNVFTNMIVGFLGVYCLSFSLLFLVFFGEMAVFCKNVVILRAEINRMRSKPL
jgi:hypothetical protein